MRPPATGHELSVAYVMRRLCAQFPDGLSRSEIRRVCAEAFQTALIRRPSEVMHPFFNAMIDEVCEAILGLGLAREEHGLLIATEPATAWPDVDLRSRTGVDPGPIHDRMHLIPGVSLTQDPVLTLEEDEFTGTVAAILSTDALAKVKARVQAASGTGRQLDIRVRQSGPEEYTIALRTDDLWVLQLGR